MAARVTVVVGPARSGKTERLLSIYRSARAARSGLDAVESAVWIGPSRRAIDDVRGRLLAADHAACFSPNLLTFEEFADRVLDHAEDEIRPIDARTKRFLVEQILTEFHAEGRLRHFAAVADRPGMVELACAFIADLKRAEIWPEEFEKVCKARARRGQWEPNDRELHGLYAEYQKRLVEHRLYDAEGRSWSARDRLQQGQRPPFERLKLVVIDGFTDLTQTQQEIVDLLAKRVDDVYVSLLDDDSHERAELFRRPRKTLASLQERHAGLRIERLSPASGGPKSLAHVERELFKNPRHVRTSDSAAGIEILAAAGRVDEIEQLARRIKQLLLDGDAGRSVRPDDVAVVFRSLGEAAPLVREIFARYGLPTAVEAGRRLDQSSALRALAALVDLDADDWPYRGLLAVTGSNFFRPEWDEWRAKGAAEAVETTIRSLQLSSGRAKLLEAVAAMAESEIREVLAGSATADADERHNRRRENAAKALPVLERLAAAFDSLPRATNGRGWATALTELADAVGLKKSIKPSADANDEAVRIEFAAWNKFQAALCTPDDLALLLDESPDEFDRPRLRKYLHDVLRAEQLPGDHDEVGRIRVLSAVTARNLSIPYLFVAGLTEKSFPSLRRDDALYGDAERQVLIDQGLRLPSAAERFADEMLLFYEVVTRAERRLWLSFPALNEKAEPLLPSPYLVELRELFEPESLAIPAVDDLSAVPKPRALVHVGEQRVRAVAAAAADDDSELALVLRRGDAADVNLRNALDVVYHRGHGRSFGPYEGIFSDRKALAGLAKRFTPEHSWSAAQLERYQTCPYQFFLERVLGLRVPDDFGLEIDHRRRGNRLHEVLAALHEEINRSRGGHASPTDLEPEEFNRLVDRLLARIGHDDDDPVEQALAEIDRRELRRAFDDYRGQFEEYDKKLGKFGATAKPALFEVSFGLPTRTGDTVSTTAALVLEDGDETVRITGRIDRIDVGDAGASAVFAVVDYKSSKRSAFSKKHVENGDVLQLPLYSIAAERLFFTEEKRLPLHGGYWVVADGGFREAVTAHEASPDGLVETEWWSRVRENVVRQVFDLVRAIRRGEFPMNNPDKHCTGSCDFRTVCRVQQTRALEKEWPAPQPEPR